MRSWQAAYRGLISDDYLDRLDPADRAARYTFGRTDADGPHTVLAVDGDRICGFATTGRSRDPDRERAGELYAIYVDPGWWSRGVGRLLMEEARRRLTDQRYSEAVLWVLTGNTRAERFYRTDGWEPDGDRRLQEIHGVEVSEDRYTRQLG